MADVEPGMDLVARHLSLHGGPPLADYKDRCLRRRLAVRMRACGAASLSDYATLLSGSPEETTRLLAALTINVTQFFRNPEVWDCLAAMLAGPLSEGAPSIRAWSAGCAAGQEPFSLALLVAAATRDAVAQRLRVDATDIDAASLVRGQAARYPAESVLGAHPLTAGLPVSDGHVTMPEAVRAAVRFQRADLLQDQVPAPPYNLILCRNVIIYFERAAQERLFEVFADALVPGGILVLGRVETITGASRERLEVVHSRERIYRKHR